MPGVAVKGLDKAGGVQTSRPSSDWFYVEGQPVVVKGDIVTPHEPFVMPHIKPPVMVGHVPWFIVDGIPVCREGNEAECGHVTTGRSWFQING